MKHKTVSVRVDPDQSLASGILWKPIAGPFMDATLKIDVTSFGFKNGSPPKYDLLIDVRLLPNPFYEPELRDLTGKDDRVRRFLWKSPKAKTLLERNMALLPGLLSSCKKEGKNSITISVGCTGGRHRSVAFAEEMFRRLRGAGGGVRLTHRDLDPVDSNFERSEESNATP